MSLNDVEDIDVVRKDRLPLRVQGRIPSQIGLYLH